MRLSRRRKRLLYTLASGFISIGITLGVILLKPDPAPYVPGERVPGLSAELSRNLPADFPKVVFTDVTRAAGMGYRHFHGIRSNQLPEDMGSGAAWGDYDNDGRLDLYVANIAGPLTLSATDLAASPARCALYHNNGDGTFSEVAVEAGLDYRGWAMGVAWGDYDNDGRLDLVVTTYGTNRLYRNQGDGTFREVTGPSRPGGPEGFWTGASWGDYDRDGDLDLYICGYVRYRSDPADQRRFSQQYAATVPLSLNPSSYPPERNLLYRNNGDGTFEEVAQQAGVDNPTGRSLTAVWCDFDEDGWPDLYVANDVSDNVLYRNRGDGTFEDISYRAWVADYRGAMGLAVGDWDLDGDQDLFISHWIAQENALYSSLLVDNRLAGTGTLPLRFIDVADRYGLGQVALDYVGWGTAFIDYDNDGRLDLFVANGSTLPQPEDPSRLVPMRDQLFWHGGVERGFFDVSLVSGTALQQEHVGRGAAFGDYDNDGDMDVFVVAHGQAGVLLRNDGGNRNAWLKVRLQGIRSNRFGVGATVRVYPSDLAPQVRQVGVQASYLSQAPAEEVFGLGEAGGVDSLVVIWPAGSRQIVTDLSVNRMVEVVEGKTARIGPAVSADPSGRGERVRIRRFWQLYRQATRLRVAGAWDQAVPLYQEALLLQPEHEDALYYLGNGLLELGRYQAALTTWKRLVAVNPGSARGYVQIGTIHALPQRADGSGPNPLFDLAAAEGALQRALEINPEETGPLVWLGEIALAKGHLKRAWHYLTQVIGSNDRSVAAYYLRGYIAWRRGEWALARDLLEQAVRAGRLEKPPAEFVGEGDRRPGENRHNPTEIMARHHLFDSHWLALHEWQGPVSMEQTETEYKKLTGFLNQVTAQGR